MAAWGARLANALGGEGAVIALRGPLGAGKTTLVRGLLGALGHRGRVRSPTYTLVESYVTPALQVHHFDLYRLADPEELEFMGIRDYLEPGVVIVVEWPERGGAVLPRPDLDVTIGVRDEATRDLTVRALTPRGERLCEAIGIGTCPEI